MDLEVLVATMHQNDHTLIDKMKLQSDTIIVNQCNRNAFEKFEYKGKQVRFLSFSEQGVGLSRNTALMRATGDICLLADDDLVYVDNYEEIVLNAFKNNPKADVIIFTVTIFDDNGQRTRKLENKKVWFHNFMSYGAVRVAFKRSAILKKNIFFSLLFGGGARYGSGEDSLFLYECLKKGLKVYTCSEKIADVYNYNSTWFKGYDDKYFIDKGIFFTTLSKRWAWLLSLQFAIRRQNRFKGNKSWIEAYKLMLKGAKAYNLS